MMKVILGCLIAGLLSGCGGIQQGSLWLKYHGDGTFHDGGYNTSAPRYSVELGAVPLVAQSIYEYSLVGLPPDRYMVGLVRTESKVAAFDPEVRVLLLNERNDVVIDEQNRLSAWRVIHGPVLNLEFLQGQLVRHYDKNGVFSEEHLGVKSDDGWGTMFEARAAAKYRLRVEIIEAPASNDRHAASLWVQGMSAGDGSRPWIDL